jgi:thiamine-phosphate pyrophosphorylase
VSVPVCAIGGINEANIDGVVAAGAEMAAVIAAVIAAPDVRQAARRLAARFG